MTKEKLLNRIEYLHISGDYEKLTGACDELLNDGGDDPTALNYKAIGFRYLEGEIGKCPYDYNLLLTMTQISGSVNGFIESCEKALKYCLQNRGMA